MAFSSSAALEGDISEALQLADFQAELRGEHTPPVTRYWLGDADQGFYVEFLAPRTGDGLTRDGQPDATIAKAGVTGTADDLFDFEIVAECPYCEGSVEKNEEECYYCKNCDEELIDDYSDYGMVRWGLKMTSKDGTDVRDICGEIYGT